MAMVGHKTEAIYRRYAIVDEGVLREAATLLDADNVIRAELGHKRKSWMLEKVVCPKNPCCESGDLNPHALRHWILSSLHFWVRLVAEGLEDGARAGFSRLFSPQMR
jgi:hypothetical protein